MTIKSRRKHPGFMLLCSESLWELERHPVNLNDLLNEGIRVLYKSNQATYLSAPPTGRTSGKNSWKVFKNKAEWKRILRIQCLSNQRNWP